MGFMNRHRAVETVDVTDLADPDGNEYYVKLRPLTGEQWEKADAAQTQVRSQMTQSTGKLARAELERRRAGRAADGENDAALQTLINIDTGAYRALVIEFCLVEWNLLDEYDRPMLLAPDEARASSISILPDDLRDRIVDWAEARRKANRSKAEDADFRDELPVGGQDREIGSPADPGDVDAGSLVVAHWADDRAGVGDLHPA